MHLIITAAVLEHVTRWTRGEGKSEVSGRIGLGRGRTDEVEVENGRRSRKGKEKAQWRSQWLQDKVVIRHMWRSLYTVLQNKKQKWLDIYKRQRWLYITNRLC